MSRPSIMQSTRAKLKRSRATFEAHRSTMASLLVVTLFANVFMLGHRAQPSEDGDRAGIVNAETGGRAPVSDPGGARGKQNALGSTGPATPTVRTSPPGTYIPGKGTVPWGINGNTIKVVYYWKGDETKTSPYLRGTGQEGNVDEGEAFMKLIGYINKHADDGTGSVMGYRFNLHGWRFDPQVIEAGKGDDVTRAATRIARDIRPFAAVSAHGSISGTVCPALADAHIFNLSTYDLDWDLLGRESGYCLPQGLSFDAQVDLSTAYLKKDARRPYGPLHEPRKYGMVYATYPGLEDSAPTLYERLRAAGIPVVIKRPVSDETATAGREQPGVINAFRESGVNTIIAPESGSLITFTHAAAAAGYKPDYFVWPCSGQDSAGMVRLYDPGQWTAASGLTCYDEHLNADLTNDDVARSTEWYKAYQEMAPGAEPPAQTPLVYQSLLQLVAGVSRAGADLTIERFRDGYRGVAPYRYDAITGRRATLSNMVLTLNAKDGSLIGDVAKVYWDPKIRRPGSATPGAYAFPENRRYRRGDTF